jgi:hypothetical protein
VFTCQPTYATTHSRNPSHSVVLLQPWFGKVQRFWSVLCCSSSDSSWQALFSGLRLAVYLARRRFRPNLALGTVLLLSVCTHISFQAW